MTSNIKFNPDNEYWEKAIQQKCDELASVEEYEETIEFEYEIETTEIQTAWSGLVDAFADLDDDEI